VYSMKKRTVKRNDRITMYRVLIVLIFDTRWTGFSDCARMDLVATTTSLWLLLKW